MTRQGMHLVNTSTSHVQQNYSRLRKSPFGVRCPDKNCKGMQTYAQSPNSSWPDVVKREVLNSRERLKLDTGDDLSFYEQPRIVHHVDDMFRQKVTQVYRQYIPANGAVLDLMSSWVSHLPNDVPYSLVVGHGMNAQELGRNKQLDRFFVRNFNTDSSAWAEKDNTFDAVVCCVSVQYMQQPECVFAEILRVLKPGGICIIAFSSRLFYTKAIQAWRDNSAFGRVSLVRQYFQCITGFSEAKVIRDADIAAPPPSGLAGLKLKLSQLLTGSSQGDPFYAVIAHKTPQ